jgi:hypothetical protein
MKISIDEFLKECESNGLLLKGASDAILTYDNFSSPVTGDEEQEGDVEDEDDIEPTDEEEEEEEEDDSDADNGNANPQQFQSGTKQHKNEKGRFTSLMISTPDVDMKNHIVDPMGVQLKNYKLNPVMMWNHEGYTNPSAIIGKATQIRQNPKGIIARVQYAKLKNNPLPDKLWELEIKGLLPGNSIGIRPTGRISKNGNVITIGKSELMDISKVAVGTNRRATNKII